MDFTPAQFSTVIGIDRAAWQQELVMHDELFEKLAYHLPVKLSETKAKIAAQLG
jgi:phosphoenolpyruvate carboxykinase (GTP)